MVETITDKTEPIISYEKTRDIIVFKVHTDKSITLPITREQFEENQVNGKLVLNVSLAGFKKFLETPTWRKFGMNRIREI